MGPYSAKPLEALRSAPRGVREKVGFGGRIYFDYLSVFNNENHSH